MGMFFYENVKYLRKLYGYSQEEISKRTGIERSAISKIENGKVETSIDNAYKIATCFNIPIQDLLSKKISEEVQLDKNHKLDAVITDRSKELTEEEKEKLISLIDTIFDKSK